VSLRDRLTATIVSGLQNKADGPGSDLAEVGELTDDGVWLYVRGDIDIHHLVSEIMEEIA